MKASLQTSLMLFTVIAALLAFGLPVFTHAADVAAVQTRQILPPGGASCSPLTVSSVTPYIYNGELHSFDVTVGNSSYVALLGTIGNSPIGFQYMTRRITTDGQLRIHVDVPMESSHAGSISLTLLSGQGNVTCMSTISFSVPGIAAGPTGGTSVGTGSTGGTMSGTPSRPAVTTPRGTTPATGTSATSSATTTVVGATPVVSASLQNALNNACVATGALQLWLILIALFIVIAVVTAMNEAWLISRSQALPAGLILAPLILLLGFWYLAANCRGSAWIPLVLLVVAAAGMIATYRNHKTIARIIELPPAKPIK